MMMEIAILMVIIFHAVCCNLSLGALFFSSSCGLIGVDIFLVSKRLWSLLL